MFSAAYGPKHPAQYGVVSRATVFDPSAFSCFSYSGSQNWTGTSESGTLAKFLML